MENEQTAGDINPTDLMIEDLAGRVARLSIEAASWRARAIKAEALLAEIAKADEDDEGQVDEPT